MVWGLGERGFMAADDRKRAATIRRESVWLEQAFERYHSTHQTIDLPTVVYLAWNSVGAENDRDWLLGEYSLPAMRDLLNEFAKHV